jgi:phosphoglycolate phosphatase
MSSDSPTLVLFDIDGTLIQSGRAGLRGMNAAFARLHGRDEALADVPIAGRTDRAIVADVLRLLGVEPNDEQVGRLREAYLEDLRLEIGRPVEAPSGVLPGVLDLLGALEARTDVEVGLLTGNFAGGAAIKLGHFGIWERFRFGAFGDDHADRRALVPVAIDEAARAGCRVRARQVVIVGDTPLDVDCALAHGARALGVATGPFGRDDLAAAGAHHVVPTLADTAELVGWLTSGGGRPVG